MTIEKKRITIAAAFSVKIHNIFWLKLHSNGSRTALHTLIIEFSLSRHCTPEKRELKINKKSEGKSFSAIRKLLDCCNKMIINALRHETKVESRKRKLIYSPLM